MKGQKRGKKRPERFPLRVIKGGFAPADALAAERLRPRVRVGDVVFVELKKPRNPGFHRLAHRLGTLCAENLDAFDGMTAHAVLKRLQLESGAGCEEVAYRLPGHGMIVQRIPRSLSYESMDETEFREVFDAFCGHLAAEYWHGEDPRSIAAMADLMVDA